MAKTPEDLIKIAKKYSNKKTVLAFLSFILVLAITILSSIPEFVINPAQVLTAKFLTKLIMITLPPIMQKYNINNSFH